MWGCVLFSKEECVLLLFCFKGDIYFGVINLCNGIAMPLSLDGIRNLNKVTLYVTSCSDPGGLEEGDGVWSQSLYSEGGLSLSGGVDVGDWSESLFGSNGSAVGASRLIKGLSKVAGAAFNVVPQLDYSHRMWVKESKPLEFTMKCYLCLENGVKDDFLIPLRRLFFLTYPVRGDSDALGATLGWIGGAIEKWGGQLEGWGRAGWESTGGSAGDGLLHSFYGLASLFGVLVEGGGENLRAIVESASDYLKSYMGSTYFLHCPPTCRGFLFGRSYGVEEKVIPYCGVDVRYHDVVGSGLSVQYGGNWISDVVITKLDVDIPKLYYVGGYPGVVSLTIGFKTLRVGSANLYSDLVGGRIRSL